MRLPVIKHINEFIKNTDEDYIEEAIAFLEDLSEAKSIKDEELDVIGELLSNMYGALEVRKMIREDGMSEKDALNGFMKRVTGSIES
jgi:Lon protease-like protein